MNQESIKKQLEQKAEWPEIMGIIRQLTQKGFQTVVAGGAVRDALLNKRPKDIDLASSAKPKEILKIFPITKTNFAKYGVALIPLKTKKLLEITSFRKDSSYKDGRRPESISYSNIKEDARRRDFTINALFYDPLKEELIDFTSGIKDLKNKSLKAVGQAKKRFEEDHLRALRALRLAHQLNFQIEEETKKAIPFFAKKIQKISKERILEELIKMLSAGQIGSALKNLKKFGFFYYIFPEFKKNKLKKNPFDFWNKDFSFLEDQAFFWTALAWPYFYKDIKAFKLFLKKWPARASDKKKALSYLKAVQSLTSAQSGWLKKLKALDGQSGPVFELSRFWLESQQTKSKLKIAAREKFTTLGHRYLQETWKKSKTADYKKPTASDKTLNKKKLNILPKTKLKKPVNKIADLNKILKEFDKRQKKGKLPPPLIRGDDLLENFPSVTRTKFPSLLDQAFEYQLKNPLSGKPEILKHITTAPKLK